MLRYASIAHRFLPAEGNAREVISGQWRCLNIKYRRLPLTWPLPTGQEDFPLVPYWFDENDKQYNYYDSTALAVLLDQQQLSPAPLIPKPEPLQFLVRLIDEFADEWGLYLVHHNRWVLSANCNNAGDRLANEFSAILPFNIVRRGFARWFSKRQTRRLPYLFSIGGQTRDLLNDSFLRLLQAIEPLVATRAFIFGDHMTLADASLYGQLAMNLSDPAANTLIAQTAPRTHQWLLHLHDETQRPQHANAKASYQLDDALSPLLREISRTFIPLMQQNAAAVSRIYRQENPPRHVNERAFNRKQGLYSGELDGHTFTTVAKTFQASIWHSLLEQWQGMAETEQQLLRQLGLEMPDSH